MSELLVWMAVERHRRAGLEADEVQHRAPAEQRAAAHALRQLEGAHGVEAHELRLHEARLSFALVTAVELPLLQRQAYVDGKWADADSGETFPVLDPATSETIADVPRMGAAETRRAVAAAERALPEWKARTAKDRARVLRRLADLMLEHEDDLARLMVHRAGQAARRGARGGAVRRLVLRVVRGGGKARLRRHDPVALARQADPRDEGGGRRHRGNHAVELPGGDADAQVGARRSRPGARWC